MKIEINETNRIYGLDALRALTMYLGVVLHTAMAYTAGYTTQDWFHDNNHRHFFYDHLYYWIHSFRMPLFFLLSGFFTILLFNKIGYKNFVKNRLNRIVIPFIACVIFILPLFAPSYIQIDHMPLHEAIKAIWHEVCQFITFQKFKGLRHFWFLLNLIYFYMGFLLLKAMGLNIERIIRLLPSSGWRFTILSFFITFSILLLYRGFTPDLWTGFFPIKNPQLLYYGMSFFLGWCIFYNIHLLDFYKTWFGVFIAGGTLLSVFNVYLLNSVLAEGSAGLNVLIFKGLYALQTVLLSFGTIGICLKFFTSKSSLIKYGSDASYWVYIIHLPLVTLIRKMCIYYDVYPPFRFWVVLIGVSVISYASYHLLVRYSSIGYYLHGKRKHGIDVP